MPNEDTANGQILLVKETEILGRLAELALDSLGQGLVRDAPVNGRIL